jgi:GGDEF domain-containing protein
MGGDEFAVAAVDTDPSSLGGLQRRLAEAVGQSNDKTTKPYQVVLSAGVLACDNTMQALSLEDLLARADALLYEQKRQRKTQGG